MCAILGWMNLKKNINDKQEVFKDMLDLMSYRGKDNTGYCFLDNILLGHKRLAIIDLENGNQPMHYKEYTIVYNGEIYNASNLREKLENNGYTFDTTCDTEVVLKAYVHYKESVMEELEGIYAFAIYNEKEKSIFLGRDRFGVKPLYYTFHNNNFIFASSIKSILKSGVIKPELGIKELGEIISLGPSKGLGSGIFKNICELRPAHYMIFKKNKIKIKRYWNVKTKEFSDTFLESTKKVRRYLEDSIKRQMVSDVDIATLLSGGLDSSIISAVVALNKVDQLTTYSIDYEGNDKFFKGNDFQVSLDEDFINIMSKKFNTNHKMKVITQEDVVNYLEKTLYLRDYPGMIDIDSSLLWFSEAISNDYKVILSGEVADEIFGGYPWFYKDKLNDRNEFPWINNIDYRQNLLNKNITKKINIHKIVKKEYKRTIKELPKKDRKDKYKKLFYINMTHFMTTLLDRKDRMTMGATIEARVPFADTKLIEYLWNVPFSYKYRNNTEKYILREAFRDILPEEILTRKKNPYPKTHNPIFLDMVKKLLKLRLENKESILYKIFNIDEVNKLLSDDYDYDIPWFGQLMTKPQLIAYLYQFDLWIEKYNIKINI